MENESRCSACGKKCKETDTYCRFCQEPIVKTIDTYGTPIENIELEKWEEFIDENSEAYIPTFRKNEDKKIFLSANFGALVFAQTWMLYRKMYLEALITYLAGVAIIFVGSAIATVDTFAGIMLMLPLIFVYRIAICVFANAIYKAHIKREISKTVPDMRKGGTSFGIAIAGSLIFSIIMSAMQLAIELLMF